jgi:hypothetical protein
MLVESLFACALLAAQPPAALPELLVISVVVTDKKGKPITDLAASEVTVKEGAASQPVTRLEADTRPLDVALVLDTSSNIGSTFASDVVPAALEFIKRLPQGARYAIWTTTDRPKVLIEMGTPADLKVTEEKLRSTPTLGNNAAVETIVAASQDAAKTEGRRSAVVLVTSATMGDVQVDVQALLPQASIRPTYIAVEFVQGGGQGDARLEDSIKLLVGRTAGFHERVFSAMAIDTQLRKAIDLLGGQYRVAWKPQTDPRQTKVEIKVSRKDVKVIQAQRLSTAW